MQTTQVYNIVIKATPEAIWEAMTTPEFTERYFYGSRITVVPDHYSSVGPNGDVRGDEPVYEFDPPRRLVHGWRSRYDPELADEDESRVTWRSSRRTTGRVCSRSSTTGSKAHRRPRPPWPASAG